MIADHHLPNHSEGKAMPAVSRETTSTNEFHAREPRLLPWLAVRKNVGIGLELHLETAD
ncbi:MAG TPA: hypothetical protein VE993_13650 [Stellaceae bacterium]|nr:hypothetical protein [Stellaceae bacterium]